MKFNEFKKEQLDEVVMKPSRLAQMADKIDALVGIEYELTVPVSNSTGEAEIEADYSYDRQTRGIQDILDFFDDGDFNSRRDINSLEQELQKDFQEWSFEQFDEWWDRNKEESVYDYVKENLSEKELADILKLDPEKLDGFTKDQIQQAVDKIIENDLLDIDTIRNEQLEIFMEDQDEDSWLAAAGLRYMADVNSRYDIAWPYYTTEEGSDEEEQIQLIADDFSQAVGRPVVASTSYHNTRVARPNTQSLHYVVEPDSSINADSESLGLEFVSPPLSIKDTLTDLEKIKKWAGRVGAETNRSTGLHMNISIPNYNEEKLDFVKLALLIGDKYVLEQFGRLANTYCVSALNKIQDKIKSKGLEDSERVLILLQSGLNKLASRIIQDPQVGKYTSINPQSNRVEFRSPGGDYFDETTDKIINTLRRFVVGLDAAMDPEKFKEDYYKKFYKLVQPAFEQNNELHKVLSLYISGDKEQALSKAKTIRIQKQARKGAVPGQKYEWQVMKIADQGRNNYFSLNVIAQSEEEAISKALAARVIPFNNVDPEDLLAIPIGLAKTEPDQQQSSLSLSDPILAAPESDPDANWAIVRNSDDAVINYFTRNTPAEAEAAFNRWYTSLDVDNNPQLRTYYRLEPVRPRTSSRQTQNDIPPPVLNGRPSNPDGNAYIAFMNDVNTPLYRFMAANGDDARTVLDQWDRQYDGNYVWRPDPRQEHGQPRGESSQENNQDVNTQWRILVDGEEVHRFWNRANQGEANQAARTWILDQIRQGRLQPAEGAEIEVVPVTERTLRTQSPEPRYVPGRDYYAEDLNGRFILKLNSPNSANLYRFNLPNDILRSAGFMDTAEINAIRFLRDLGYSEEDFSKFAIHDTRDGTQLVLAESSDPKTKLEYLYEKWSKKYKNSIDCSKPKGFSQRAHCQGRKKK